MSSSQKLESVLRASLHTHVLDMRVGLSPVSKVFPRREWLMNLKTADATPAHLQIEANFTP